VKATMSQTRLKKMTRYPNPLYWLRRFASNNNMAAKNTVFSARMSRKAIRNWRNRRKRVFIVVGLMKKNSANQHGKY